MAETHHCIHCFDVLAAHYERRKPLTLAQCKQIEAVVLKELETGTKIPLKLTLGGEGADVKAPARPLFVTWNKHTPDGHRLRGCIGTFESMDLEGGLRTYALTAALEDTRFSPIRPRDLSSLSCGVSILTDFEPAADAMDWTLGVHGLRISFIYHGRRLGATYLPDVPVEQGWTKEETIVSLMRKAGWSGRQSEWKKVELSVTRYKGTKKEVMWEDYRRVIEKWLEGEKVEEEYEEEEEDDEE